MSKAKHKHPPVRGPLDDRQMKLDDKYEMNVVDPQKVLWTTLNVAQEPKVWVVKWGCPRGEKTKKKKVKFFLGQSVRSQERERTCFEKRRKVLGKI